MPRHKTTLMENRKKPLIVKKKQNPPAEAAVRPVGTGTEA